LATEPTVAALDKFPLQLSKSNITKWLQDFVAPFYIFSRLHFESLNKVVSNDFLNPSVSISTKQVLQFLSFKKIINESVIEVKDNRINAFSFIQNKKEIKAICTPRDY
jgi:hypothetical protein